MTSTSTVVRSAHRHLAVLTNLDRRLRVPAGTDVVHLRTRRDTAARDAETWANSTGWDLMDLEDRGVDTTAARVAWRTVATAALTAKESR